MLNKVASFLIFLLRSKTKGTKEEFNHFHLHSLKYIKLTTLNRTHLFVFTNHKVSLINQNGLIEWEEITT